MSTTFVLPVQRGFALIVALALVLGAMVPLVTPTPARASSHVWINEIHYDNTGTDTGEAIELAGTAGTDLTGWSIVLYNGANGLVYNTATLSVSLPDQQGGFGTAVQTYPTNGIQNGAPDGIALVDGTSTVVQFLSYEGVFSAVDGPAAGMASTDIGVSQSGSEPIGDSLQLTGTGTSYADFTWATSQPNTFGAPNTGQTFGDGGSTDPDPPTSDGGPVVVSQVYGGGGNSGAFYTHDFIELFNRTTETVSLSGWSVQYASASGSTWQVTSLSGSIPANGYYLVQQAQGAGGTAPLPEPDAAGSINMSATNGKVALVASTSALAGTCPIDTPDAAVDFVGYGTANCFEGDAAAPTLSNTTAALRLDGGATDTDHNDADFESGAPDPRNSGAEPPPPEEGCGDPATFIHEVQGSGMTSPLAGQIVTIEGVVVGDFQNNDQPDNGNLGGFHVQEEDADADGDPTTSEGIFVFASSPDVMVGDQVRVTGTVTEFGSSGSLVTELTSISQLLECGTGMPLPAATPVTLPVDDPTDFERYEGMLVTFPQSLVISEYFNFDRFGEIVLTTDRQFQPTAVAEPGSPEADAIAAANRLSRITLDDGRTAQNPDPAIHPDGEEFTLENRFRGGDQVTNVTGIMDDAFGLYRIQPTQGADYTPMNPRPMAPEDVGGSLTVASFNVLNYFTTIDDGTNDICGPDENQECRGADDANELERQRAKIIAALAVMDADVVGLIEIENHPADVPTADLVAGLNDVLGAATYDYVETGAIGGDAIRVALIYKPGSVSLVGDHAILDSTVDSRFDDERNRPVLAQAFEEMATGGIFTVAVNHLKSKGSGCGGPPDDDPQQGNCNGTRTRAAEALVDWLAADPTGSGDLDALIMGDLNAYDKEDPIDVLRAGADGVSGTGDEWTDLVLQYEGEEAYSFVFDGQLGYLDHAVASPTIAAQVTGATIWHINADEPDILDYDTSFKQDAQDALFEPNPYRSSDHDPVIVGLDLLSFGLDDVHAPPSEVVRAGRVVPVTFTLDEGLGLDVLFGPPQVFVCGEWPSGDSQDAQTPTSRGLEHDPGSDEYAFPWKTDRSWAGSCRTLAITFQDGSYVTVSYEFR